MIKRLMCLFALVSLSISGVHAQSRPEKERIYIGQVSPLSGPAASIGIPLIQGAHVLIRKANRGREAEGAAPLVLLDRDDAFHAEQTVRNVENLLSDAQQPVVALINIVGSPNSGNLVTEHILDKANISLVGAFTGSTSVRALRSPRLYFVRAGVASEAEHIVNHFVTLGVTRIALVHPEDTFGRDALEQTTMAMKARKLELAAVGHYSPATTDMDAAVSEVLAKKPQAIALFATGAASAKFISAYRAKGGRAVITTSSSTSADYLVKTLPHEHSTGVGVLQAVPALSKTHIPIVKEYLDDLHRYGERDWAASAYGLEGYIAAKILVNAIASAGAHPTAASVSAALAKPREIDVGGVFLDYRNGLRDGSQRMEIGVIAADGRLRN